MVGMGRLVSVGTAPVLLLLSCLVTVGSARVRPGTDGPLFYPSRFVWNDSHFSLPPVNESLILWLNASEQKLQVLDWPQFLIRLPKGEPFSGYLYFRDKTPASSAHQVLPHKQQNLEDVILKDNALDYCVAINIDPAMLEDVPGYHDESLVSPCMACNSSSCPGLKQPCACGWVPIDIHPTQSHKRKYRPFVGVEWWDVDDKRLGLIKKAKKGPIGRKRRYGKSVKEADIPEFTFQKAEPLKSRQNEER